MSSTKTPQELEEERMLAANPDSKTSQGCPVAPYNASFDPANSIDKLGEAADALGMSETCKTKVNNIKHLQTESSSTTAVVVAPFAVGGANTNTNSMESYTDTGMSSEGCGKISVTANAIKMEQTSMTCNMNKTINTAKMRTLTSANLLIETIAPKGEALTAINSMNIELAANIAAAQADVIANSDGPTAELASMAIALATAGPAAVAMYQIASDAMVKVYGDKLKAFQKIAELNSQTATDFSFNNPITAGITGTEMNQSITSAVTISSEQNINSVAKTTMKASMARMAKAVALDKVKTHIGPGSIQDSAKTMVSKSVDDSILKSDKNVEETITENKMSVDTGNNITLRVHGPMRGSEINQTLNSQVSVTVMQAVKKSVEIGNTVATKIITDSLKEAAEDSTRTGMDAIVAAAGAADAAAIDAAMTEGLGDAFRGAGDGIGGALEGAGAGAGALLEGGGKGAGALLEGAGKGMSAMMMAAMIPLIIVAVLVVVGVFIFPKLAPKLAAMSGASPGMIKIGGMILFACIIAAVVWFFVMPHFKSEESRRRTNIVMPAPRQATPPVNTQPMKSPYQRAEARNFKGARTARKIPSYKKINQSYNLRPPTEKNHTNVYNPTQLSLNPTTVHNPSFHFQNKVDDKPVAYTKKSRV